MRFGLREDIIERINSVFEKHPQVNEVVLYGSRAKGNFKNGSDIDLTIKGEQLDLDVLNKITWQLDDLLLPWKIDISIYQKISNSELIEHINRVGKLFYIKTKNT